MYRLLSPVIFDRFSEFFVPDSRPGGGNNGNNNSDDDDDGLEDPPEAVTTGNAIADQVMRDYLSRNTRWIRRQRSVVAGYRTAARNAESTLSAEREAASKKATIEPSELTTYEAYKALGTPDELKTKIANGETAASEAANLKRDTVLRDAAGAVGYNLPVLRDRVGTLSVQMREIEVDGQKTPTAFITDSAGKEFPLSEYAEKEWSVYLPALVSDGGNGNGERIVPTQSTQQFPSQGGSRNTVRNGTQTASAYMGSVYKGPPKRGT